ncbi:hypothetical protein niasHT_030319 [Heterodera trifolii]|uniref:MATH domain-containing protein n=1 Tax=Heterodera trifolii TaxID=157864 RepID=A0ABD2KR76_9BILA
MLSFIYADDLSELDGDNAMAVLYAAKKYLVNDLIFHCSRIEIESLPNIILAFVQARLLKIEFFAQRCLRYICQNAGLLLETDGFLESDQNCLCEIFDRDQLLISNEFQIWKCALRWADEKCRQNAIECTAENRQNAIEFSAEKRQNAIEFSAEKRRSVLGPALFKIRFPQISAEEFDNEIVPSGILSKDEVNGVYQFLSHPNLSGVPGLYPLKFPYKARVSHWNIPKGNRGTIAMEIEKLSEFAQEEVGTSRFSDAVQIMGMPWKILAEIQEENDGTAKYLGFYISCTASEDEKWVCSASATLRIVSQKSSTEDIIGKRNNFELMDPSRGFYEEEEDKVTLAIDLFVEEPKMDKFDSDSNQLNGKIVMEIGKLSEFAREICWSERRSETVHIKGMPWQIWARIKRAHDGTEKWLGFYLLCADPPDDENWKCICSATFQIIGTEALSEKRKDIIDIEKTMLGFEKFVNFKELMDPSKGFYNEDEDKVKLAIDFSVEENSEEQ